MINEMVNLDSHVPANVNVDLYNLIPTDKDGCFQFGLRDGNDGCIVALKDADGINQIGNINGTYTVTGLIRSGVITLNFLNWLDNNQIQTNQGRFLNYAQDGIVRLQGFLLTY
ncbi:MAG: hypothetical protein FWH03_08250 [Firmicutes bacterium]|nr:hypothetical protein [Bacillota bacterium]